MEAETGVMWPQRKGCQQTPEAVRGKERVSLRTFEGNAALLVSRTVKEYVSVVLSHKVCDNYGFSKMRGFDVRFIWQRGKNSREAGTYQHKMNGRER